MSVCRRRLHSIFLVVDWEKCSQKQNGKRDHQSRLDSVRQGTYNRQFLSEQIRRCSLWRTLDSVHQSRLDGVFPVKEGVCVESVCQNRLDSVFLGWGGVGG